AAAARPRAQSPVLEKVLVALRREPQVGFGVLSAVEPARQQTERALVDLRRPELQPRVHAGGLVDDARRRRVAQVLVLRADDRRGHLPRPRALLARQTADGRVRALDPGRPDE